MKGDLAIVLLLLGGAALFSAADSHDHVEHHGAAEQHDHADDHHFDADFDAIDHRLDELTARFIALEHRIEHRTDPARITKARSLRARVEQLEGNGCDANDYQCGGTDPQCVGKLLVCDGIKDCRNGADESHCEIPLHNGDHFHGAMIFDHCTKRRPKGMDIVITSVRHSVAFNSVVKVTANMEVLHDDDSIEGHVAFPVTGYYAQASHKLVFYAPEKDRLYVVCDFDGFNFDKCVGHIKRETGEECASLIFVRQK